MTRYNVACRLGSVRYIVELEDVSATGAQILIRQGLIPRTGQKVALHFMNATSIDAIVVWNDVSRVGLSFCNPLDELVDIVDFDDLGAEYFGAVLKFQLAGAPS